MSVDQGRLNRAMDAFLESGFHPVSLDALEHATGLTWDEVRRRFGDKEGLFLAAIEARLQALASQAGKADAMAGSELRLMLERVRRAGSTPMLRAQHKAALNRLLILAEAAGLQSASRAR